MIGKKIVIKQQPKRKLKGVADIVFVIDNSRSMRKFINELRSRINDFINTVGSNPQLSWLDYRLGIVCATVKKEKASYMPYFYELNFTSNIEEFKKALGNIPLGGNEFTLPAIDRALDFPWRKATRIVIVFTDETIDTGYDPEYQKRQFPLLRKKIKNLHITLFLIAPKCKEYEELATLPKSIVSFLKDKKDFEDLSFINTVLQFMGKTVSQSLVTDYKSQEVLNKEIYPIYPLKRKVVINLINPQNKEV